MVREINNVITLHALQAQEIRYRVSQEPNASSKVGAKSKRKEQSAKIELDFQSYEKC